VLRKEVLQFRPELHAAGQDGEVLLGRSPAMRDIYRTIRQLSRSASTTVLIEGESGTGKELIARAIHYTSSRREEPFVAVNCAALTETLLEAELFGYEKGAFTGAAATGKIGLFEAADGGTIFLDEIGEMGFELQAKLLRVLQDKKFMRVGGTENISVDVRVIASTNRKLQERVREGSFRHDLYFRLKVVTITAPPLRERKEDILPLAKHFLDLFSRQFSRQVGGFSPEAEKFLLSYPWPGNVRELRNIVESSVILETGEVISARHLQLDAARLADEPRRTGHADAPAAPAEGPDDRTIAAVERRHILRVLNETMWQRGQAADILGIHRTTLANKIREYGIANA
jgi:two-component system response regulator AtoC